MGKFTLPTHCRELLPMIDECRKWRAGVLQWHCLHKYMRTMPSLDDQ